MDTHARGSVGWGARVLITAVVICGAGEAANAATTTWWVTNQGVDSPSCGDRTKPCRSISQALEKAADGAVTPTDATNNYWGSPSGPGPDPADNAGKSCDFFQSTTVVKPFAAAAFGISP